MRQSLGNGQNSIWPLVNAYVINLVTGFQHALETEFKDCGVYICLMCIFSTRQS